VGTPELRSDAEEIASRGMARIVGEPVNFTITQYQTGTGSAAVERAQLAAVQAQEQAAVARADALASRLALVAGVLEDEVIVDRQRRRAVVRAQVLDGASLAAYSELEKRIARTEPEWRIELIPPIRALPRIDFDKGQPTAAGTKALALIAWSAKRLDLPIMLSGGAADTDRAKTLLTEQGLTSVRTETKSGPLTVRWDENGG
jgi:hypothetical protein